MKAAIDAAYADEKLLSEKLKAENDKLSKQIEEMKDLKLLNKQLKAAIDGPSQEIEEMKAATDALSKEITEMNNFLNGNIVMKS